MTLARRLCLRFCSRVEKPVVPRSTRKPRTTPSRRAQTIATCERSPFVIHIFAPFNTKPVPSRTAFVSMPPGSLP